MKLSLTERALVDIGGVEVRQVEEMAQLQITKADLDGMEKISYKLTGFTDLGIVEYLGVEYYASTFQRQEKDEVQ